MSHVINQNGGPTDLGQTDAERSRQRMGIQVGGTYDMHRKDNLQITGSSLPTAPVPLEEESPWSPSVLAVPDGSALQPRYISLKVAAATVGLSTVTLKRAIKAGNLNAFKPGGKLLIRPDDLEGWVEARPAKSDPMPQTNQPARPGRLIDQALARREGAA